MCCGDGRGKCQRPVGGETDTWRAVHFYSETDVNNSLATRSRKNLLPGSHRNTLLLLLLLYRGNHHISVSQSLQWRIADTGGNWNG